MRCSKQPFPPRRRTSRHWPTKQRCASRLRRRFASAEPPHPLDGPPLFEAPAHETLPAVLEAMAPQNRRSRTSVRSHCRRCRRRPHRWRLHPRSCPRRSPLPPGREPVVAGRPRRHGARQRRTARPAAQQCRRSQHFACAAGAAAGLDRIQPRRAVAHRDATQGAAAQARDRDRGADPAPARERGRHRQEFDPLELDRYSSIQQFSRALAESASDVAQHPGTAREPDRRRRRTCCSSSRAPSPSCRTG